MTQEPIVIVDCIKEPVSVYEAKLWNKIDYTEDDLLIGGILISAARDYVESQTGRTIHEKTLEIALDCEPCGDYIELPRATPLISVTSVTLYDTASAPTVMDPADYIEDTYGMPGRIVLADGASWPSVTLRAVNGIVIRYKAGLETASPEVECSSAIKYPVMLLVNSFDRNRSAETVPDRKELGMISLRYGVEAYIERLRVESVNY